MKNLLIYKASAGSGKTHMLTQEYLKLAFQHPEKYKTILAVTFTNKAADEMKERILSELNNIYLDGEKSAHFNAIAETYPELSKEKIQELAFKIRSNVLHNYSQFSVSTIDSFVQKVIRSFSYEIGVHGGYKIEIETDKVLFDLTELLYKKIGKDKNLLQWLVKFAEFKIEDGRNWDFRSEVYDLGKEIFKERFQSFADEISEKEDINKLLKTFYTELLGIRNSFRNNMKEIGKQANLIINNAGLQNSNLGRNFGTIKNYLCNKIVKPKNNDEFIPLKTIYAAQEGVEKWYAKSAKADIRELIENVYPALNYCLNKAINEYEKNFVNFLNAVVTLSNYHAFGLLNEISKLLPEYRDENNLLLISDTTLLLKEIIGGNDAPFIYEKIGNRYQNILIDEFQDTSNFQWSNFKPLILNSIAEGLLNLIVGDVKQSIYRWRGGDWKLLLQTVEEDVDSSNVENKTLNVNWRSKKNILDFNNELFRLAPKIAAADFSGLSDKEGLENSLEYSSTLIKAYADSYQELPPDAKKIGGRAKVKFYKVGKKGEMSKAWRELMNDDVAETIDFLLKNKNYTPKDIAVLVRKNSEAKQITNQLISYLSSHDEVVQYNIVSEESLSLAKSTSIRIIISALNYMFDDKRDIFRATLESELERLQTENIEDFNAIFGFKNKERKDQFLSNSFYKTKKKILQLSLFEQVEEIVKLYKLNKFTGEYPYIRSFQDVVLNFTRNQSSDLGRFLDWWENEKHRFNIQISDKQDAVRVVTVHKSKGLAFGVVLVPFADWKLEVASHLIAPTLWAKTHEEIYKKFSYLPIKYQKTLAKTQYKEDYFEEKLFQYMDGLNALYVALTRAKEELILFMPTLGKIDKMSSVADLVFASILSSAEEQTLENKHFISLKKFYNEEKYEFNLATNYKEIDETKYKKEHEAATIQLENYTSADWSDKLSIKTDADNYFVDKDEYRQQQINYGTLMHEIISKVHLAEDVEKALQEAYFAGKISIPERKFFTQKINNIVENKEIADWFTNKYEIKTETEILTATGDKKIPDRLLLTDNELIVIDFKFGKFRNEHLEQVQEYKDLLSTIEELQDKTVSGFLYYAEEEKLVEV